MHNTTSALPELPCFVCGTNEGNEFLFSSRGHYPSRLLDDDGRMFLVLCATHLTGALDRGIARRYDDDVDAAWEWALPCVRCGRGLDQYGEPPNDWRQNQPVGGLCFQAREQALSACEDCVTSGWGSRAVHLVPDDDEENDDETFDDK